MPAAADNTTAIVSLLQPNIWAICGAKCVHASDLTSSGISLASDRRALTRHRERPKSFAGAFHPTGFATSDISGHRSTAWSDYRRATASHRTWTFRCRQRIRRPRHKAQQPRATFRLISSKLISTCHPLFRIPCRPFRRLRPASAFSCRQYFATTGPPNLKSRPKVTTE
jgi:hypothetical protein